MSDQVLWQMMKDNPGIRRVCLCLDHDEPGQAAARRIAEKLKEHGIPSEILVPIQKDWNEDLQELKKPPPEYMNRQQTVIQMM